MLPYAGTAIAAQLEAEGRLTGGMEAPDYPYHDPRLHLLQLFFTSAFHHRNFGTDGIVERLRYAKLDALTLGRFFAGQCDHEPYLQCLLDLIHQANASCLETMSLAVRFMEHRSEEEILRRWWLMEKLARDEIASERQVLAALDRLMSTYSGPRVPGLRAS
jgi:hypothetical protein